MLQGHVYVRQCLGLDPLGRIHHQKRPLTGRQAPGYFVGKIHMPRRIDEVQLVNLAVFRRIFKTHRLRLDGNAPLSLQIHGIQHLRLHLPCRDRPRPLDEPVGQRGFSVVDMSDDGKIAYILLLHGNFKSPSRGQ